MLFELQIQRNLDGLPRKVRSVKVENYRESSIFCTTITEKLLKTYKLLNSNECTKRFLTNDLQLNWLKNKIDPFYPNPKGFLTKGGSSFL